ncbi:GtrA family protein [Flavisolibacter ginsenosidimutans]|uniref:GtrA family protein n=1 Tax=Flavisolibacter ginsenosidimutans TaxID=661481 RepID=A0A5B8UE55_9BACT|nr:GtrA family protein [Flavisolibacter ginsenosidimutans]QEC54702.1 GtrA family protein [Flavisolibacter ginsenosidimutans]
MRKIHNNVRKTIFSVLDIFYPMFRRFMPLQTYHYAACGGSNTLFNIFLYHIFFNYVLHKQVLHLGFIAFTPYVAAFILAFFITFPIGFYLSMYVVFQGSYLRRRIQLVRYLMVALACVGLNYILLKFFIETLGWHQHPTLALMATAVIVVVFSYVSQRFFSFRTAKPTVLNQSEASVLEGQINL